MVRESNAAIGLHGFCLYDMKTAVREKSSTYDKRNGTLSGVCRGGYIDDEEERRGGGALRDSHRD